MPTMVTFQAGTIALAALLLGLCAACSSEQQDWHSAQSADTTEAWQRFIEQHPQSELATQARLRIAQLDELQDWRRADGAATVDAYRHFLARHPNGRWSEQARIRIEAFSLGSAPRIAPETPAEAAAAPEARGVRALQLATGTAPAEPATLAQAGEVPLAPGAVAATAAAGGVAQPGEAAQPVGPPRPGENAPAADAVPVVEAAAGETSRAVEVEPPTASAELAARPTPIPVDGYGVQLGAFGNPASADREWQRLQVRFSAQLAGLSPRIVVASTGLGQLYRLQASAGGEAQARAICDTLKGQSQACVPVLPR
jgi:SPOR domain